ncbi:unnamed protein product [Hapterophycus canaliculatus]
MRRARSESKYFEPRAETLEDRWLVAGLAGREWQYNRWRHTTTLVIFAYFCVQSETVFVMCTLLSCCADAPSGVFVRIPPEGSYGLREKVPTSTTEHSALIRKNQP